MSFIPLDLSGKWPNINGKYERSYDKERKIWEKSETNRNEEGKERKCLRGQNQQILRSHSNCR